MAAICRQPTNTSNMVFDGIPYPVYHTHMRQAQRIPINVPPGLEYLTTLDQIFIEQKREIFEICCGYETENKYYIRNQHLRGEILFKAKEETDCCTRQCFGGARPFDIDIREPFNQQREVIHLTRPLSCDSICCPCILEELTVTSPPGILIGAVEQVWSCFPSFVVKNKYGEIVLQIEGPGLFAGCYCDVEFKVFSAESGEQIGKIKKKWSGCCFEMFTDADNFKITFPADLDVRMKAVLIGACFLIDFMYFENNGKK